MVTQQSYNTIIIPSASTTDDDFDTLDIIFEAHEQAEPPITEEARLWWFNGLPTDSEMSAIGWHIRAGINPELDQTCEGIGLHRYMVQHKRPDQNGNNDPKPYWRLRQCNLIVVTQRLQSPLEMNRTAEHRQGIAYGWEPSRDAQGNPLHNARGEEKRHTVLKCRVFIHELYRHGYYNWFPLTLSGFSTDEMLLALGQQYRVLDTYSSLRRAQGRNAIAPFYLFSIPLGPGAMKLVGEPPDQGTIYPIVAQTPTTIEKDYLKEHFIGQALIGQIREGLITETAIWSIEESARIIAGRSRREDHRALPDSTAFSKEVSLLESELTPSHTSATTREVVVTHSGPLVDPAQLAWIERQYCRNDARETRALCARFGVPSPLLLRQTHFKLLVKERQSGQFNSR